MSPEPYPDTITIETQAYVVPLDVLAIAAILVLAAVFVIRRRHR